MSSLFLNEISFALHYIHYRYYSSQTSDKLGTDVSVYLQRSKIREMSSGHETGAKTCCPAAHWAGWERPVGGAEQSMPPPTLRPESYRFLLCVKSRCWCTSKGNEGREKGRRRGKKKRESAKECERWSRKQKAVLEVATCPPPFPRLCLELLVVTCRTIQTQPPAPLPSESWLYLEALYCRDWHGVELEEDGGFCQQRIGGKLYYVGNMLL